MQVPSSEAASAVDGSFKRGLERSYRCNILLMPGQRRIVIHASSSEAAKQAGLHVESSVTSSPGHRGPPRGGRHHGRGAGRHPARDGGHGSSTGHREAPPWQQGVKRDSRQAGPHFGGYRPLQDTGSRDRGAFQFDDTRQDGSAEQSGDSSRTVESAKSSELSGPER